MKHAWLVVLYMIVAVACDDDPINRFRSSVERRQVVATTPGDEADATAPTDSGVPDTATDATTPGDTGTTVATDSVVTEVLADTEVPDTSAPPLGPERYPAGRVQSPITPSVVANLQAIAAVDPALQDDVFMKVGASTTVSPNFFACFAGDNVDFGSYGDLASTRDFFLDGDADGGDPFSRKSLAAKSGVSAGWALDGEPPPLEAEYLAVQPRFAFVHYGTNDMGLGATYQSALFPFVENLWNLIDDLRAWGVVPVMATILHRLDEPAADLWVSTYNGVISALAQGRQVPLVDLYTAYEGLPNHGLGGDGLHSSLAPEGACQLTPSGLAYGYNVRNLEMLTALARVEAAVLDGEAADAPRTGSDGIGTSDDPIVIDALPFHDLRSTSNAPSDGLDHYTGCNAAADESGPEVVYRLAVSTPTRVRMTVHDRGTTDIDLHLLDETASEEGCVARNHQIIEATLAPGIWHIVLDTFVSAAGPRTGEYLLSIVPCPANDPTCG